ncbi:MAG: CNNM domain-containing protein [bacterium]|nr:CNNM domain-containing protein [bacterium]
MTIAIVLGLVLLSGLFSGLTLGLLSLSKTELERKIALGDQRAIKIYQVRRNGSLLLTTLLLGNVAVNSVLAVFLGSIATGVVASLISTGLIVVFGEVIPMAAISRYALTVGAKTVWVVKVFQFIFFPIVWPMAKLLDITLGEELPIVWSKQELEQIVAFHEDHPGSPLDEDEERIIKGALNFSEAQAGQVMTPREKVFALELKTVLDTKIFTMIQQNGFTRIPVYALTLDVIVGILYTKQLIGLAPGTKLAEVFQQKKIFKIDPAQKLDQLLNRLVKERMHQAFVYNEKNVLLGIVTLEDIIEEILRQEIEDEYDHETADVRSLVQSKQ